VEQVADGTESDDTESDDTESDDAEPSGRRKPLRLLIVLGAATVAAAALAVAVPHWARTTAAPGTSRTLVTRTNAAPPVDTLVPGGFEQVHR
jgi:hypothetical protein